MLNLTVDIDSRSGFCFGVTRAIGMAEKNIIFGEKVYSLGDIVHNEEEVARLRASGLDPISGSKLPDIHHAKVLIRAHGEPPETYVALEQNGNEIIDATCPIVLKIQDRIRQSCDNGEFILIFGKPDHPEVVGLVGQAGGKILVFNNLDDLNLTDLPPEVTLFSQTTMSLEEFHRVKDHLIHAGIRVTLKDTVCRHVSGRKTELQQFCRQHDSIVFVAGQHSSNGKVLFDVCKAANVRSYKISSVEEILPDWFAAGETVGICGATSTPQWQLEQAAHSLESL